jgi:hypothetical protein
MSLFKFGYKRAGPIEDNMEKNFNVKKNFRLISIVYEQNHDQQSINCPHGVLLRHSGRLAWGAAYVLLADL